MKNGSSTDGLMHFQGGKRVTETHELLLTTITERGQLALGELLDLSSSEISRKINGENGFNLRQLAQIFDFLGVRLARRSDIVVDREEYESMVRLAHKALTSQVKTFDGIERRISTGGAK